MPRIAGVDGCPAGWLCLVRDLDAGIDARVLPDARALLALASRLDVLAVDIPIGFTDAGIRLADQEARDRLKTPRASSVFPAPIRPALRARDRVEASRINRAADGRGVGTQAWELYPKIRDVDESLRANRSTAERVWEIHPEVSFWAWSGERAMTHRKKDPRGRQARLELVTSAYGAAAWEALDGLFRKVKVADDDILDAFAALWTAERILRGEARSLPDPQPLDSAGLPMRIVY